MPRRPSMRWPCWLKEALVRWRPRKDRPEAATGPAAIGYCIPMDAPLDHRLVADRQDFDLLATAADQVMLRPTYVFSHFSRGPVAALSPARTLSARGASRPNVRRPTRGPISVIKAGEPTGNWRQRARRWL